MLYSVECGMWYRRITEIMDIDPPPPSRIHLKRSPAEKVQFGQNAFQGLLFGPIPPSKFPPVSAKRKRNAVELAEDDIAHFKRIRLITSKERVRFIPGPFRQVQIFGRDLSSAAEEQYKAEESSAWVKFRTLERTLGPSHPDTLVSIQNLTRILRNIGRSSAAEDLLQKTLKEEEAKLIDQQPGSLRILMTSLMISLVDQKKLEAAEELWTRAAALFTSNASAEENDALIEAFKLAHPFRRTSPLEATDSGGPQMPSLEGQVSKISSIWSSDPWPREAYSPQSPNSANSPKPPESPEPPYSHYSPQSPQSASDFARVPSD